MRVLVTGGAGFIGAHVVRRLLADGHQVTVLSRHLGGRGLDAATLGRVTAIEGDACDLPTMRAAAKGCHQIFAFAALVGVEHYTRNPVQTMLVEEQAIAAACAVALEMGCSKVIYPSSSAVYGAGGAEPLEEEQAAPTSNYAVAKRFNELFLRSQFEQNGLNSVSLRIFNVYGPGQNEQQAIPSFVRKALTGEPLTLFGEGSQRRDFVYIDDVVEAVMRCSVGIDGCETVNVATGTDHSVREVAETVIRLCGDKAPLELRPLPPGRAVFEVQRSIGHTGKLARLTGFQPRIGLEDGIRQVIEAYGG